MPHLVEMWLFTFTSILPYMQAVFLPLDLEFAGLGPFLTPAQAVEFWGIPASTAHLEVRRIVLLTYRDIVILPRFDTLKTIFSRLSLESINGLTGTDILSSSPDSVSGGRPGTAMSLDPSLASYNSQTSTLLDAASTGARSRAISNVSFASDGPPLRPFTPNTQSHPLGQAHHASFQHLPGRVALEQSQREANAEDSKMVTEMVGRMLQCMSVLASVGAGAGDEGQKRMEELCRALKLNWLGRGRTGRNRRGFVGARVGRREESVL